jgi:hypothetical protein
LHCIHTVLWRVQRLTAAVATSTCSTHTFWCLRYTTFGGHSSWCCNSSSSIHTKKELLLLSSKGFTVSNTVCRWEEARSQFHNTRTRWLELLFERSVLLFCLFPWWLLERETRPADTVEVRSSFILVERTQGRSFLSLCGDGRCRERKREGKKRRGVCVCVCRGTVDTQSLLLFPDHQPLEVHSTYSIQYYVK